MLDPAKLHFYDAAREIEHANGRLRLRIGDRNMVASACHFDPSFGSATGDGAVVACVYICDQGEYWLHDLAWLRASVVPEDTENARMDEASQLCAQVAAFMAGHHLPSVRVETNGIGRFLPNILRRELKSIGWAASVVEHHESTNKATRIEDAFGAVLGAGLLHVHEPVRKTPFVRQMREWHPDGKDHDDGLDAVAGCILSEPVRLPRVDMPLKRADWRAYGGIFNAENAFNP